MTELPAPQEQQDHKPAAVVPCVCSTSPNNRNGRVVSFATSRGYLIEYCVCERCGKTWQRHGH